MVGASGPAGAVREAVEPVVLASGLVLEDVQVKAAGGISTLDLALEVRAIGGTRFGTLQTVEILEECKRRLAG